MFGVVLAAELAALVIALILGYRIFYRRKSNNREKA